MNRSPVFLSALSLLAFGFGCAKDEIVTYDVAKPPPRAHQFEMPKGHSPMGSGSGIRVASGDSLIWEKPAAWTEKPASGMRRATFIAGKGPLRAEMSVVALPGRAGGRLANVNRWRSQIGLAAIDAPTLAKTSREVASPAGKILVVDLNGRNRRMLAAILDVDQATWFFKMTGPKSTVTEAEPAFLKFLASVRPR